MGGRGGVRAARRAMPTASDKDAAFRRFLASQREGLRAWAAHRARVLDEVGLSSHMEALVADLLEELRHEPPVRLGAPASGEYAAVEAMLMRACAELKFVERHAQQAVGIVLARAGSAKANEQPTLLSDTLDWLCVNVPVDELPLAFRPRLRTTLVSCGPARRYGAYGAEGARASGNSPDVSSIVAVHGKTRSREHDPEDGDGRHGGGAAAAIEESQLKRLTSLGFLRSRAAAALHASHGVEEAALASLLTEMIGKLSAADLAIAKSANKAIEPLTQEDEGDAASGGSIAHLMKLCEPATADEEESLTLAVEEEDVALAAILGTEYSKMPGGCRQITLLWDSSTGEAPWTFSAAHAAEVQDVDRTVAEGKVRFNALGRCTRCVIRGCRQPVSRHVPSAYCTRAHADADVGGAAARLAGVSTDGFPLMSSCGGNTAGVRRETLELLVVTAAGRSRGSATSVLAGSSRSADSTCEGGDGLDAGMGGRSAPWPYPRAPPLVAVRCAKLLPETQRELSRLLAARGAQLVMECAKRGGEPAGVLFDLIEWLRSELPKLLNRLVNVIGEGENITERVRVEAGHVASASGDRGTIGLALAQMNGSTTRRQIIAGASHSEREARSLWLRTRAESAAAAEAREMEAEAEAHRRWGLVNARIAAKDANVISGGLRDGGFAASPLEVCAGSESVCTSRSAFPGLLDFGPQSGGGDGLGCGGSERRKSNVEGPRLHSQVLNKSRAEGGLSQSSSPLAPRHSDDPANFDGLTTPSTAASHAISSVPTPTVGLSSHGSMTREEAREGLQMLGAERRKASDPSWRQMQSSRGKLPAAGRREGVLDALRKARVLVVSGETGCGKTTQVPQFILDDAIYKGRGGQVNIICTQPRRLAAIGVAERVASERCEPIGKTIGYQIRLEARRSAATRLLFCTTGILLRRLSRDRNLDGVSHVIVDEVHERSLESDFLLTILRDVLSRQPRLQLVLMSATINAALFASYFGSVAYSYAGGEAALAADSLSSATELRLPTVSFPAINPQANDGEVTGGEAVTSLTSAPATFCHGSACAPTLAIPGFVHPVSEHFIEEVLELTGFVIEEGGPYAKQWYAAKGVGGEDGLSFSEAVGRRIGAYGGGKLGSAKARGIWRSDVDAAAARAREAVDRQKSGLDPRWSETVVRSLEVMDEEMINVELIVELVCYLDETRPPGAVLIFLPGTAEIAAVTRALEAEDTARARRARGANSRQANPKSAASVAEDETFFYTSSEVGSEMAVERCSFERDGRRGRGGVRACGTLRGAAQRIVPRSTPATEMNRGDEDVLSDTPYRNSGPATHGSEGSKEPQRDWSLSDGGLGGRGSGPLVDGRLHVLPLHSGLSSADQRRVFAAPPSGARKIVVSTNVAETSLTIDDVVIVIDSGRVKLKTYDAVNHLPQLIDTWTSAASRRQRRGRAGRVRPGEYWALFSTERSAKMPPFTPPEMSRVPLHELCLQIKLLDLGDIETFLSRAPEPPSLPAVSEAVAQLRELRALDVAREALTPLGKHLATLPVDVRIGKMLLYACMLRCLEPALVVAASLSLKSPFNDPPEHRQQAREARRRFAADARSDHFAVLAAFTTHRAVRARGKAHAARWCRENFCSAEAFEAMQSVMAQFVELLLEIGFLRPHLAVASNEEVAAATITADQTTLGSSIESCTGMRASSSTHGVPPGTSLLQHLMRSVPIGGAHYNANAKSDACIRAVLCAGLYPNVVRVEVSDDEVEATTGVRGRKGRGLNDGRGRAARMADRECGGDRASTSQKRLVVSDRQRALRVESPNGPTLALHPASVNAQECNFPSRWLVYFEKVRTSRVFLRDSTMVTPYPLLLFGGEIVVSHAEQTIAIDEWISFRAPPRTGVLFKQLRAELDRLLLDKIEKPHLELPLTGRTIDTIVALLEEEVHHPNG